MGLWKRITGKGVLVVSMALSVGSGVASDSWASQAETSESEDRPTVVFAGSANYPPFQWQSAGGPRGFVVDLEEAMAARGGRRAIHELGPWEDALESVANGDADVVALFASEARREQFDFSTPFYFVAHGIFVTESGPVVGRLDDLGGLSVGVVAGGYAEQRIDARYPGAMTVPCVDIGSCLTGVAMGDLDVAVVAAHTARRFIADQDLPVRQSSAPLWPRPYVFGVQKGRAELLEWVNEQLAIAQVEGDYHRIYNTWVDELEWQEPTLLAVIQRLAWIVVPLLLLTLAAYGWSWMLRRQVAARTRALSRELQWRRELESELQYRVGHDDLTGLPNRDEFLAQLEARMAAAGNWQGTVITIRVINLEQMITAFSYDVGHDLVKAFGERIGQLDAQLVGHFGAGVFAVVMPAGVVVEDVLAHVTRPLELDAMNIDPQIALGVVESCPEGEPARGADELLRQSRTALAAAQAAGRRWLVYTEELEPDPDDLLLLRDFHRVGTQDMFLVFQPKLDLASGRVNGAEALIRWDHPELGLVSPVRFIPLLEQSGLISQITYWVIDEACRVSSHCSDEGFDCSISVNVAAQDLLEMDLLKQIAGLLGDSCRLSNLRLEITETGFMEDPVQARQVLNDLRSAGIFCAVDDFGTGYSSLSYLSEFPVDEVKIDRVFVTDMNEHERHRLIVRSTIALAHELGLKVTAEGAEDMATIRALADLGCDAVQGFVLSKPVPEAALMSMLGQQVNLELDHTGPVLA